MQEDDVDEEKRLMETVQQTKDGEDELDPEVVFAESEKEDEEDDENDNDDEFDDDDESSPVDSSSGNAEEMVTNVIVQNGGAQNKRKSKQERAINGDLVDVNADKYDYTEKNSMQGLEINMNAGSSGMHGSSAIGYDSEDNFQAVNLQIELFKSEKSHKDSTPSQTSEPV